MKDNISEFKPKGNGGKPQPAAILEERMICQDPGYRDMLQRTEGNVRIVTIDIKLKEVGRIEISFNRPTTKEDSDLIVGFYTQGKASTQRALGLILSHLKALGEPVTIRGAK